MFRYTSRVLAAFHNESFRMNSYILRNSYQYSAHSCSAELATGLRSIYSTRSLSIEETLQKTSTSSALTEPVSEMNSKGYEFSNAAHRIYAVLDDQNRKNTIGSKFVSREECLKVLEFLIRYKVPEDAITTILLKVPVLLTFPYSVWEETVMQLLKNYQFNPIQVLPILADSPSFLKGSIWKSLHDVLSVLRGWGMREGQMQTVVLKNPELLYRNLRSVQLNYRKLCEVFTKSNVFNLILSTPNVLTDEWETTQAKINYVHGEMGVVASAILDSSLFKHSLDHIIIRHEFLQRAGLYCKPDKHGVSKTENASLKNITNTNDKAFAKHVAGLTEEEYVVFALLKRQELQEKDELADCDTEYFSD